MSQGNHNRLLFTGLSLLLVLPLVATNLFARNQDGDEDSLYKHLAVFTEVVGLVNQAYVEPADEKKMMAGALDGAADALDPFSFYVPPEALDSFNAARAVGPSRSGLMLLRERGFIYVAGVADGSPANQAKIQVGDMVAEIDGENTNLTTLWEAQAALASKDGTEVALKLFRNNELMDVVLRLGPFESRPVELADEDGTPVLRLFVIEPGTAAQAEAALAKVAQEKKDRLLVDLRGVAGGDAAEAYKVAGLFVEGELGSLRDRSAPLASFQGAKPRWQGKTVLLVDRGTLGPSEVIATVLRQKADAELVGERTFGHAGRLAGVSLAVGGELWLTDAFYTGPDGEPLTESLQPDLFVSNRGRVSDDDEGEEKKKDLILEKGLVRLLSDEEPEEEKLAA